MTLFQLQPPANPRLWRDLPLPGPVPAVSAPAPMAPAPAPCGGLLQFQLNRLIADLLAQPDLDPDTRVSLLVHLVERPGRPEQALVAHLRDIQDPEDLPASL
ncbi:hypothetical protein B1A87_013000 [Arthrobacter sp. KBS0703]|uniref:hypothetical protein n=1 Tax=Bacteria TaxID=2 RepID=UPI00098F38D4|nr:hypothetical protein [Arthrobacter sp. KBS0703]TSE16631.1 hypothetical protein B1A87_013000 [Arthrobacter sp. KBS0703]